MADFTNVVELQAETTVIPRADPLGAPADFVVLDAELLVMPRPDDVTSLGSTDFEAPVVTFTPPGGQTLAAGERVHVAIADAKGALAHASVTAEHGGRVDVVFDGAALVGPHAAYSAIEASEPGSLRLGIGGAWQGQLTLRVVALDAQANVTRESASYPPALPTEPPVEPPVYPLGAYDPVVLARLLDAGLALLPPGRAFSRRLDSLVAKSLEALLVELARVHLEASALLGHISPRRARREDYLSAWEEAVGIVPASTDPAARAAAVASRIRAQRDHTLAAYEAAAQARGMTVVWLRRPPQPFRAGLSQAGDAAWGDAWVFVFVFEVSGAGDLDALERDFRALARAHTIIRIARVTLGALVVDVAGRQVVDVGGRQVRAHG